MVDIIDKYVTRIQNLSEDLQTVEEKGIAASAIILGSPADDYIKSQASGGLEPRVTALETGLADEKDIRKTKDEALNDKIDDREAVLRSEITSVYTEVDKKQLKLRAGGNITIQPDSTEPDKYDVITAIGYTGIGRINVDENTHVISTDANHVERITSPTKPTQILQYLDIDGYEYEISVPGGGAAIDDVRVNGNSVLYNRVAQIDLTPYQKIELSTPIAGQTTVEGALDQLKQNIDSESVARYVSDKLLQTNIDNEATARADADTQLQANIDAEVTRATGREDVLEDEVIALNPSGIAPIKVDKQTTGTTVILNIDSESLEIVGGKLRAIGNIVDVKINGTSIVANKEANVKYDNKTIKYDSEGFTVQCADSSIVSNGSGIRANIDNNTIFIDSAGQICTTDIKDIKLGANSLVDNFRVASIPYDNDSVLIDANGKLSAQKYTGDGGISVDATSYKISALYDDTTIKLNMLDKLYVPIDNNSIKVASGELQAWDVIGLGTDNATLRLLLHDNTISTSNYIVSLDELNDKIASNLGTFRGTSDVLPTIQPHFKNNDYCFLQISTSEGTMYLSRYKLVVDSMGAASWEFEYKLTLSTFTADQWKTLNSNIDYNITQSTVNHLSDTSSHVSTSDRSTWNGKQDGLTAGDNISITGTSSKTIAALDEKVTPLDDGTGEILVGTSGTNGQPYTAKGVKAGSGNIEADGNIKAKGDITSDKTITGNKVKGSVWNDYAEYRKTETTEAGRCVREDESGEMKLTTDRLQLGCEIISDTFGFSIGQTEEAKSPIAIAGRVLAYTDENKQNFKLGMPVCSGPNGTVSQMTEEEARMYPWCIIGTVSEIPTYKTWGTDNIEVNDRIWIRVR